jgi:hypothetical protein
MMQKANVSHGKIKMDKMAGRRELPCVRRSKALYRWQVVRDADAMSMSMERKKCWGSEGELKNRKSW